MKLSELIAAYGDDKVALQNMDECTETISMNKKGLVKATIVTDENFGLNGFDRLGLILWLDRQAASDIINAHRVPSPITEDVA